MNDELTLSDVLKNASELPWDESLCLPADGPWTLASPAMLWDQDEVIDDEEELAVLAPYGVVCVLGLGDVQDIVSNARQQKADCTISELFDAFMYYLRNDAFIQFS
jgi:hypothetical protein